MNIQPIVLSGGSGTRLWPLSRENHPKQLLTLGGGDSLLQATVRRVDGMVGVALAPPLIVCNEEYRFVIAEQMRELGKEGPLVLEPVGRNTAPALTLAALAALAALPDGGDAILLVMPADHVITDTAAFQAAVRAGAERADAGALVTFGVVPDAPETGYGYIQTGRLLDGGDAERDGPGARAIARFVEKPDRATAQRYLDGGDYLWNSGIFMMRASVWRQALGACRPDILAACEEAWAQRSADSEFLRVGKEAFERCPADSIDYAVMEKIAVGATGVPAGVVIALAAGWSDVGAWDAWWQVQAKDGDGNVAQGDVYLHECRNTLAISASRLVACIGVDNLVVVETPDAILISNKETTQGVKEVVARLKREGRCEGLLHRKVFRPWGSYDGVDVGERFLVKRIIVKPGARLSLQMHHHRAEHWIVVRGTARVTREETTFLVSENESTFIPLGKKHRLENPGVVPLEMIEVQSGSYLGEDDIVRFDDIYGR